MKKRWITAILTLAMALALLPATALAVAVESGWTGVAGNTGTMAYQYDGGKFDIHGSFDDKWLETTYNDNGFATVFRDDANPSAEKMVNATGEAVEVEGTDFTLKIKLTVPEEGNMVKITYSVYNGATTAKTCSFGSHADVQIGKDDNANITRTNNGFMMESRLNGEVYYKNEYPDERHGTTHELPRFNFFCKGWPGMVTTDVDTYWFGAYSERTSNVFNNQDPSMLSFLNQDSGMAYSWKNQTIPAGQSRNFTVVMNIGGVASSDIINSGAALDDYNEETPPSSYSLTAAPTDVHKQYALQQKTSGQWVIDTTIIPTGTKSGNSYTPSGADGWWSNDATEAEAGTLKFDGILPGTEARIIERLVDSSAPSSPPPGQTLEDNKITVDAADAGVDVQYELYKQNGDLWEKVESPTTTSSGGKLTFTLDPADAVYQVRRTGPAEVTGETASLTITSPAAEKHYSVWDGDIPVGDTPVKEWGAAVGDSFTWDELDPGKTYTVKSRMAEDVSGDGEAVTGGISQALSAPVTPGEQYGLYKNNGSGVWVREGDLQTAGAGVSSLSFSAADPNGQYKVMKIDTQPATNSLPLTPSASDKSYALYVKVGDIFVPATGVTAVDADGNAIEDVGGWYPGTGALKWTGLDPQKQYEVRSGTAQTLAGVVTPPRNAPGRAGETITIGADETAEGKNKIVVTNPVAVQEYAVVKGTVDGEGNVSFQPPSDNSAYQDGSGPLTFGGLDPEGIYTVYTRIKANGDSPASAALRSSALPGTGILPPTPPSSHSGYTPPANVTVYNDPSQPQATIWLTGGGLPANDLLITDRLSSGDDYNAMLRLADAEDIFRAYNIYLRSGKSATGSPMYLHFDLADKYAGQTFTLAHKLADGTYEYFYATADANGDLTFGPFYSLSPFLLVKGTLAKTPSDKIIGIPKTGNNAMPWLWVGAGMMGLAVMGVAYGIKKRQQAR